MDSEIVLQIFSGGFLGKTVSFEAVEQKLLSVLPRLPVRKVIMGWSPDKLLYDKTAGLLAKKDIDFFLWFPVFSETGALKTQSPLVDLRGRKLESGEAKAGEDFAFCCPNHPQNIENVIDIFEKHFASGLFTGVFLDKIRYPSFAQGRENVFSCFCPQCQVKYEEEKFDSRWLM